MTEKPTVEGLMDLAFQWAHAAYCKGLGRPHSDIEPIRARLRTYAAALSREQGADKDAERLNWIEAFIRKHDRMPEFHPDWPNLRAAIDAAITSDKGGA